MFHISQSYPQYAEEPLSDLKFEGLVEAGASSNIAEEGRSVGQNICIPLAIK